MVTKGERLIPGIRRSPEKLFKELILNASPEEQSSLENLSSVLYPQLCLFAKLCGQDILYGGTKKGLIFTSKDNVKFITTHEKSSSSEEISIKNCVEGDQGTQISMSFRNGLLTTCSHIVKHDSHTLDGGYPEPDPQKRLAFLKQLVGAKADYKSTKNIDRFVNMLL